MTSMREVFADTTTEALDHHPELGLVLADISADRFVEAAARYPDRVINVGIREQLMVSVAGGLALSGMRPVVHTFAPFLVERPYEQIKLDLNHQGMGAVLVSSGGSYDYSSAGRTHMGPADVALLDTLPGWTVHVPGHPNEVRSLLRHSLAGSDTVYIRLSDRVNPDPFPPGTHRVRSGRSGVVVAVGPTLGPTLAATALMDVTVLYTTTPRPFDFAELRRAVLAATPDVVLVEPYLRGTSAYLVDEALADLPHRVLALGVRRDAELRAYGTPDEHEHAHGLGPTAIAAALRQFLTPTPDTPTSDRPTP